MKRRSKSSARWLKEHFADPFVQKAQSEGWRSRAVFKLEEIDRRARLLKPEASRARSPEIYLLAMQFRLV